MAQLKTTIIQGDLGISGNIVASKIIKSGGTRDKILLANGDLLDVPTAGLGTVTSVAVSSDHFTITGSPVTTSGTIKINHPTKTETTADIYKVGMDGLGHVVLGNKITPGDLGLATVYNYRGTITWDELKALTSAEVGDVYSIATEDPEGNTNADWACYEKVTAATGDNYATYWQSLGGKVNLSAYVQGPTSSTTNAIARYSDTTGKIVKNSTITIGDNGTITPTDTATTAANALGTSSNIWKDVHLGRLQLYSVHGANTSYISFWKHDMKSWYEYMAPKDATSPNGKTTIAYGDVTSYARRSMVEPNAGYGWIWEGAANGGDPTGKMALSSNTGNLTVAGSITANGFTHSGLTAASGKTKNDYVLLAGGSTKPLSDFASSSIGDANLPLRLQTYTTADSMPGIEANTATEQGWYYVSRGDANRPPFKNVIDVDSGTDYRIMSTAHSSSWVQQIATNFRSNDIFIRRRQGGTWQGWTSLVKMEEGLTNPTGTTNAIPRWEGTKNSTLKNSGVTIDDSDNLAIPGKVVQGTVDISADESNMKNMNLFANSVFISGDGAGSPNQPKVAGFYLGKSADAKDVNRHLDIVSGGTYSYIDFNTVAKAGLDYSTRLIVDATTGLTELTWDKTMTNKKFQVSGDLVATGSSTANGFIHSGLTVASGKTKNDYALLAGGGTKALADIDTWREIKVDGTTILGTSSSTSALNLKAGTNVSINATANSSDVTINAVDTTYTAGSHLTLSGTEFSVNTAGLMTASIYNSANSAFDANNLTAAGSYRLASVTGGQNLPTFKSGKDLSYGQILVVRGGGDTVAQLAFHYHSSEMAMRVGNAVGNAAGTWKPWVQVATQEWVESLGYTGAPDLSNYVTLNGVETITGNKTFTGNVVTSNNKFEIKATGNTDDSWIKLTNASDDGYYAFGIRRPYNTYGLQLKIKTAGKTESEAEYYDIWNANNDGSGSGLDADLLDGKHASDFATSGHGHTNMVTGSGLTANAIVRGSGNSAVKTSTATIDDSGNMAAKSYKIDNAVTLEYDSGLKALKFVFA